MSHKKAIINVQFRSNLSREKLQKIPYSFLDSVADVEGLIVKYYYSIPESDILGVTYIFENLVLARNYINIFLTKGVGVRYDIIPETLKIETGIIYIEVIPKK